MWTQISVFIFFFAQASGYTREKERIFRQEIHSLKRELEDQINQLRDEISHERVEFMALWNTYLLQCQANSKARLSMKFEEIQLLKADIEQYDSNLEVLEKKLERAKYSFRSEVSLETISNKLRQNTI